MTVRGAERSGDLESALGELRGRIEEAFEGWGNAPEHVERRGVRLEVSLEESPDPFVWLQGQTEEMKLLWSSRDREDVTAGVGCAWALAGEAVEAPGDLFARGAKVLESFGGECPRFFGGFAFAGDAAHEPPWPRFGRSRFVLPRWELFRREGGSGFACNLFFERNVHMTLEGVLWELERLVPSPRRGGPLPAIVGREDFPGPEGWEANVLSGLDLIRSGILDKVVLARKAVYRFEAPVEAAHLLAVLRPVTSTCYHFLFQPDEEAAFMGTTPECLYRREGRELRTEALAGTRPRGADGERDAAYARDLLANPKDRREQELVRRDVLRQLHLLSEHVEADERPSLLPLERKQHLISRVRAVLREGVGDAEVLRALHPTPAVGGSPRGNALKEIPRLEPFSRGWYAAPVGWFGMEDAEFAVAIRSGLVRGDRVNVYSGAGIVEGSDPEEEWREIENKISDFVKVTRAGRREEAGR